MSSAKFNMERFNHKMLYDMEVKERYEVKISNRSVALGNLNDDDDDDDDVDISKAWESIRICKLQPQKV
jgi:hypothetical protein